MRAAIAAALLLAGCAAGPLDAPSGTGAPIDDEVVAAARAAGFAECPAGPAARGALEAVRVTCMPTGESVPLVTGGLPLVVNVWASWCEPCRTELPLLGRAAGALDGRVLFVGVDFADAAPLDAIALAEEFGVRYPQLADPDSVTRAPLGLRGLPQTVFIDETGAVVGTEYTPFDSYDDVLAAIEDHLGVSL